MAGVGLSLPGLVLMAGGFVLAYSGLNDPVGGPVGVVKDVLSGKTPTPNVPTVTQALNQGIAVATSPAVGAGATVGHVAKETASLVGGSRGKIVAVAKSYLGVKYVWGGQSRNGIDCSGLILVAYRDGAGLKLPHRATLQAARGRRIERSEVLPGDVVAWGVPGNYPHIALALSADEVIAAPHIGTVVQVQKLWEKKVPGFGYPDIIRILED